MKRFAFLLAVVLIAAACGGENTGGDGATAATTTTVAASATTTTADPTATTATPQPVGEGSVAQEGDSVAVHYIGTLDDGTVFDESRPRGSTLDFVIGTGGMIAGFDQGVRGMAEGETKTVRIEPAEAYGEYDPEALFQVDISQVPEGTAAGDVLVDPTTGSPVPVVSVEGDVVTLDLNHQLAGQALTFEIEMVSITR
jgi:FKBP-type peptidyl-prolyl cis-trans isomerase 2